jgi:hypothetical protein
MREGLGYARKAYELDPLQPNVANTYGVLLAMNGQLQEACRIWESAVARWPHIEVLTSNLLSNAARGGDWDRVDALIEAAPPSMASGEAIQQAMRFARNLRRSDTDDLRLWLDEQRGVLRATGTVSLQRLRFFSELGLTEEAFKFAEDASFAHMFDPAGPLPAGGMTPGAIFNASNRAMIDDRRFVALCAKLGLCDYWLETGRWPDCADQVPYDFRAEARRLAGSHG